MPAIPPPTTADACPAPLDELRRRHWEAYLALRERIRLAAPEDLPGLHEELARLQEQQQREEVALMRSTDPPAGFAPVGSPRVPPLSHDNNQEL